MALEAHVVPRQKEFKYRVEFNGYPIAYVQSFSAGERTIGVTEHAGGGQNHVSKEGGMNKYADAVLKVVVPIEGVGLNFWEDWMNQVQNPTTGNGLNPSQYWRNFSMYELRPDGTAVRVWEYYRSFPSHMKPGERTATAADKDYIEEIHISYEFREMRLL